MPFGPLDPPLRLRTRVRYSGRACRGSVSAPAPLPGADGLAEPAELLTHTTETVENFCAAAGGRSTDPMVLRKVQRQRIVASGILETIRLQMGFGPAHERLDVHSVKALVHLERNELLRRQNPQGLFMHPELAHHREHPLAPILTDRAELAHCSQELYSLLGEILLAIEPVEIEVQILVPGVEGQGLLTKFDRQPRASFHLQLVLREVAQ